MKRPKAKALDASTLVGHRYHGALPWRYSVNVWEDIFLSFGFTSKMGLFRRLRYNTGTHVTLTRDS